MIRPGIGYIRLGSFGMTSHKEVSEAMDSLKKKGMKDLIFDLEDNGGGYLQTAAKIANEFLEKGDLIVYTKVAGLPVRSSVLRPMVAGARARLLSSLMSLRLLRQKSFPVLYRIRTEV